MVTISLVLTALLCAWSASAVEFSASERAAILAHGPWPPPAQTDPTNRASGNAAAIRLGEALFHDARLSRGGAFACVTCHLAGKGFSDGQPFGMGRQPLQRNTLALWNLAGQRWFGWAGQSDSLWVAIYRNYATISANSCG